MFRLQLRRAIADDKVRSAESSFVKRYLIYERAENWC